MKITKEEKTIGLSIKNRWNGDIIFQSTKVTYKEAVEEAIKSKANLSKANLSEANLYKANLSGADLYKATFFGKTNNPILLTNYQLPDFLASLGFKLED